MEHDPDVLRLVALIADRYQCFDCDSETELIDEGGLFVLKVRHDTTCPTLARIESRRASRAGGNDG